MLKENATGDSLQEWQTSVRFLDNFLRHQQIYYYRLIINIFQQEMEKYTAPTFIDKARFYLKNMICCCVCSEGALFDLWCTKVSYFYNMMHQDIYGSGNFRASDYAQIISDMETFVHEFAKFDRKKLWDEFDKTFITETDTDVKVEKATGNIKLGGYIFKCNYSLYCDQIHLNFFSYIFVIFIFLEFLDTKYEIALLKLDSKLEIDSKININETNNKFYYIVNGADKNNNEVNEESSIDIPIEKHFFNASLEDSKVILDIKKAYSIDFSKNNVLAKALGFNNKMLCSGVNARKRNVRFINSNYITIRNNYIYD
uniref:Uncharacterized protein n=1 Tax=Heterorhabditis bacteriophora TaxID=37862 RepID=A0A1I7WXI7_HETBA